MPLWSVLSFSVGGTAPPERFPVKLSQIEQFDVIGAVHHAITRRRRARRIEIIRNNADAAFFAGLAEQRRLDERRKRAERIFSAVFGAEFADMKPWQRQLAYDVLKARDQGQQVVVSMPLRPW